MGIKGLLPHLKSIQREKRLLDYKDLTLAVDGYSWLHKSIHGCGIEIVQQNDFTRFLKSFLARVVVLRNLNIKVVMVFDGDKLPSKDNTEEKRAQKRAKNKTEADSLYMAGNIYEADKKYECSIDITPTMARKTLDYVRTKYDIECIVAPYEADSQLAYLAQIGYVDGILTEDSDLLVFNGKSVLFKLDHFHNVKEIKSQNIKNVTGLDFSTWDHDKFIQCCILAGCDYLKSPRGIAFKTAHGIFKKHKELNKIFEYLKKKKNPINDEYILMFKKAFLTFKYQTVWDPVKDKLVSMNPIFGMDTVEIEKLKSVDLTQFDLSDPKVLAQIRDKQWLEELEGKIGLDFLGPRLPQELAKLICTCKIDPETKREFEKINFGYKKHYLTVTEIKSLAYMRSQLPAKYQNEGYRNSQKKTKSDTHSTRASKLSTAMSIPEKKDQSQPEPAKVLKASAEFELNNFASQSIVTVKPKNVKPDECNFASLKLRQSSLDQIFNTKKNKKEVFIKTISFDQNDNNDFDDIEESTDCIKNQSLKMEEEAPDKDKAELDLSKVTISGERVEDIKGGLDSYKSCLSTAKAKKSYKEVFARFRNETRKSSIKSLSSEFRNAYINRMNDLKNNA